MGKLYLGSTEITPADTKIITTYEGGNGIIVDAEVISIDQNVVALKEELPTKTSQLINDKEYQTLAEVDAKLETKQNILTAGENVTIEDNVINAVDTVYTAGDGIEIDENNVIKNTRTSATWGNITGTLSSQVDLSEALASKQGTLTPGDNVTIENGTISAVDTTYTAGTGINITDGVISSTSTVAAWGNITGTLSEQEDLKNALDAKQGTLTPGANITIENGVISAAEGHTYTNGDGLSLTDNIFAVDSTIARTEALNTGLSGKQDIISDLSDIRSNATAGKTASDTIAEYGDIVTHDASEFASADLIPEQASATNKLADKDYVNSSVATNTAYFKGTYNTLDELKAVENPTNNDYGFVKGTDESGNAIFNRYKYNSNDSEWSFEYSLNNSSFTANQWSAINSGITEEKVSTYDGYASTIAGKQDSINDLDTIRSGAALGATALQSFTETDPTVPAHVKAITTENISSWNAKSDFSGSYNDLTDKPTIPDEVTESTVSGWGFTKNEGTVTGATMNGADVTLTNGILELGTVIREHQDISGKADVNHTHTASDITEGLSTVATTGSYNDLIDKPEIPTVPTQVSAFTNDAGYVTSDYHDDTKQDKLTPGTNITIENGVISASTGTVDYTELTNKPKINNVELSGNKSLSDLGIQPSGDYALKSELFSGNYEDLENKPTIPSNTSDLTNDSGFITDSYHDDTKQDVLVSGTTIKTINGESVLGEGDIVISGADIIDDETVSAEKAYSSEKVENLLSNTIVWKQW